MSAAGGVGVGYESVIAEAKKVSRPFFFPNILIPIEL